MRLGPRCKEGNDNHSCLYDGTLNSSDWLISEGSWTFALAMLGADANAVSPDQPSKWVVEFWPPLSNCFKELQNCWTAFWRSGTDLLEKLFVRFAAVWLTFCLCTADWSGNPPCRNLYLRALCFANTSWLALQYFTKKAAKCGCFTRLKCQVSDCWWRWLGNASLWPN